ncbi:hypothetical protein D3C71_2039880 [compost metagenome]
MGYRYADHHCSGAFRYCREYYRLNYRQDRSAQSVLRPDMAALFISSLYTYTDTNLGPDAGRILSDEIIGTVLTSASDRAAGHPA